MQIHDKFLFPMRTLFNEWDWLLIDIFFKVQCSDLALATFSIESKVENSTRMFKKDIT